MKLEYVERGIHRRGRRYIVSFALADGKIERRSVGMCSVEKAHRKRLNWMRDVSMGTYQKKQPRKPEPKLVVHTVKDLWDAYLVDYRNRGGKDAGRLEIAWMRLEDTFAKCRVANITTKMVKDYIAARQAKGLANGTINRQIATLRAMFIHGTKVTPPMVDRLPAFPTRLKESKPRKGFVNDTQYAALAKNAKSLWMRALIACYYNFEFRKGEMLQLRVEQVDLLEGTIELDEDQTKTEDDRKVKMTGDVYKLIVECIRGKKTTDFVFTREGGGRRRAHCRSAPRVVRFMCQRETWSRCFGEASKW